ncbi:MAG: acylphosphatase [Opitutales bacterium]
MNNSIFFAKVIFEGRVQGVGFRLKVFNIAKGYEVLGFVQNKTDGTVLLNATGQRNEVLEFVQEIKRIMAVFIRNTEEDYSDIEISPFKNFDIR